MLWIMWYKQVLVFLEKVWNILGNKPMSQPHHTLCTWFNTLRPRQNGRHFPDDIFKFIFMNENDSIVIKISLKFIPKGPINNIPALVQIMAWRRLGDKPLSEPMMVNLLTHVCVTRPQWVKPMVCCWGILQHAWHSELIGHARGRATC